MNAFWLAQLKKDFLWAYSYKIAFFGQFFGIFITVFTFFFISKTFAMSQSTHLDQYGNNYFLFAIIGISLVDFISTSLRTATKTIREAQAFGFIDIVLNAKITPHYYVICSMIYPCCIGLIKVFLYLLVANFFKDFDLSFTNVIYVALISILTFMPFLGVGLLGASFVLIFKQGDPVNFFVTIFLTMLSGVLFPISVLPEALRFFSSMIPVTYSLDILRKVIIFNSSDYISLALIYYLLLFSAALFSIGVYTMGRTIVAIKLSGQSGRY